MMRKSDARQSASRMSRGRSRSQSVRSARSGRSSSLLTARDLSVVSTRSARRVSFSDGKRKSLGLATVTAKKRPNNNSVFLPILRATGPVTRSQTRLRQSMGRANRSPSSSSSRTSRSRSRSRSRHSHSSASTRTLKAVASRRATPAKEAKGAKKKMLTKGRSRKAIENLSSSSSSRSHSRSRSRSSRRQSLAAKRGSNRRRG
uniref:Uncharacterized protein n=1 Tax=Caenorhabditis japonica TaxID=281687 RepID=A0A8R1IBZ4_CAEJA